MKDLDFDELDKAVNSLMTSVPKTTSPPTMQDEETTLDIPSTLDAEDPVSFDKLDTATDDAISAATSADEQKSEVVAAAAASMAAPAAATTPPAARRGGRFMDVVHPSSDMKIVNKPTTTPRAVSRQGSTIEPVVPVRSEANPTPAPVAPSPIIVSKEQKPSEITDAEASSDGWPDPLEMADFKDDIVPKEEEWSANSTSGPVSSNYDAEPTPLTSPFLPDTKVEKRPLGSSGLTVGEESDTSTESAEPREDKTVDDPNDQLPAMPDNVSPQLPEELQSDMMSVEADTHMGLPKTEATHPMDEKLLESGLPAEPATKAVAAITPTGPVSIPQQYREEPNTGDQNTGGIYDTDSYHRPLEHPAKKKAGWMWIVWIIVILLAGAGAGVAVYFAFLS